MIIVSRALPNPSGKDRTPNHLVTNDQLNAEWVEFGNVGKTEASIDGWSAHHYTFNPTCQKTGEDRLLGFVNSLLPGLCVRVHSGRGTEWAEGRLIHVYAQRENFAWNNKCGDFAVLRDSAGTLMDYASYDPAPPDGAILVRVINTNRLTVSGRLAAAG